MIIVLAKLCAIALPHIDQDSLVRSWQLCEVAFRRMAQHDPEAYGYFRGLEAVSTFVKSSNPGISPFLFIYNYYRDELPKRTNSQEQVSIKGTEVIPLTQKNNSALLAMSLAHTSIPQQYLVSMELASAILS